VSRILERLKETPSSNEDMPMTQTSFTAGAFEPQSNIGGDASLQVTDELETVSNLAALLDGFTASLANPDASSVGEFAHTVQALHSELAMLAGHFRANGDIQEPAVDFDILFPVNAAGAEQAPPRDPAFHGVLAEAELEQLCQMLSR
jgi:hypothetical protein